MDPATKASVDPMNKKGFAIKPIQGEQDHLSSAILASCWPAVRSIGFDVT